MCHYENCKTTLKGDALSCWNNESKTFAETEENFVILKKLLTKHVFPRRALRLQKRCMRRHMRKPADVSMRDYDTRCVELNNYLELFPDGRFDDEGVPTGFSPRQKLDVDELADIMEFGTPSSWQKKMVSHGFDPLEEDDPIQSLVEFCERVETVEGIRVGVTDAGRHNFD